MAACGSFPWPLVVRSEEARRTLPLGLQSFHGQCGTKRRLVTVAALPMLVPNIIIFLAGQRFFVAGLNIGAVKG